MMVSSKDRGFAHIILILVLVTAAVAAGLFFLKKDIKKVDLKFLKKGIIASLPKKSQPAQYYATLSYNPKTSRIIQLASGKTQGLIPNLSKKPVTSPDKTNFRVEVLDNKNKILQKGWLSVDKKLANKLTNIVNFRLVTLYGPKNIVKVYNFDNKLAWTGVIK